MIDNKTIMVSVVIPTYNHSNYLGRALKSVFDQTYSNFEIIVIDNHSTDDTKQVIDSFNDSRINYLKIQNNGVIAASRNLGIRASKGEWIAFLDSDDFWSSSKLQECFNVISENVDLVYHDLEVIGLKKKLFKSRTTRSRQVRAPVIMDLLIKGNGIVNSSVVVRKNLLVAIGGINESDEMIAAEDFNTWLRISQLSEYFIFIPKTLGFYLMHKDSASKKDMSIPERAAISEFFGLLNFQQKNKVNASIKYTAARFNYLNGNYELARKELWYVLRHGRLFLKIKSIIMIVF